MTQTGFIFRAGRTPVNGRTIANKVGASVRKRKTTGTHHLFRANPLHYIHATPCDERRIICCKEKEANDCVQDIMNNIIQQRYAKQRIYFSRADHHSFRNFFPLKKKANAKDKTRRVARLYIRIGFKERIRERRKIYFCRSSELSKSVSHTKYEYFTCRSRNVHSSCRCGCRRKREERREETSVK